MLDHKRDRAHKLLHLAGYGKDGEVEKGDKVSHIMKHEKKTRAPYKVGGSVEGKESKHRADRPKRAKGGWIKSADLKKGAFTAQADKAGKSVHEYAEEKKDAPGKTGKRARLALTFEKMARK